MDNFVMTDLFFKFACAKKPYTCGNINETRSHVRRVKKYSQIVKCKTFAKLFICRLIQFSPHLQKFFKQTAYENNLFNNIYFNDVRCIFY